MLQQAEGTGSVQILGGLDEEILVEPDPEKLGNYGIPLQALAQAIMATNTDVPAGSLEEGAMEYIVKTSSPVKQAQDISGIPVFNGDRENGFPRIRDLARITPSTADRTSFVLHENREGIALLIRAREGYSPVSLSKNVCAKINEIQHAYGSSLCIMALSDTSTMITSSIRDLLLSALAGMIIAFFVIVLFLGNFRSSCLVTLSIPLSILSALAVFPLAGVGINIMSMGGLAIGTGMLVDNPVVVLENLQRKADPANRKEVINATVEIGASTIGSTFTSLIVFLPLFFLPGIMGVVFRDMAWAISLSLLSSFVVSISALPVLFTRFGLGSKAACPGKTAYRRLLRRAYRRPAVCAATGLFLLCTGLLVFFFLEKDWLNTPETNRYLVRIQLPPGSSIEYQKRLAERTQRILAARKEIAQNFFYGGGDYRDPYYVAGKDPEHETVFCHVVTVPGSGITAENAGAWFSALFADKNIQSIATPESLSFNEVLGFAGNGQTIFPVTGTTHREALSRATRFSAALSCPDTIISPAASRTHFTAKPRNDVLDHLGLDNASNMPDPWIPPGAESRSASVLLKNSGNHHKRLIPCHSRFHTLPARPSRKQFSWRNPVHPRRITVITGSTWCIFQYHPKTARHAPVSAVSSPIRMQLTGENKSEQYSFFFVFPFFSCMRFWVFNLIPFFYPFSFWQFFRSVLAEFLSRFF